MPESVLRARRPGHRPWAGRPPRPAAGCAHPSGRRRSRRGASRCRGATRAVSSRTSPASVTTTRRANPPSFRHSAIASESGDHANERWPGPHAGSAWSCGSARSGRAPEPSRRATTTFHQPDSSVTYASHEPSGENRGWPTDTPGPPATTRTPSSSRSATTMRDPVQDIASRSHSCQAIQRPSSVVAGSHAKSASDQRRTVVAASREASSTAIEPVAAAREEDPAPAARGRGRPASVAVDRPGAPVRPGDAGDGPLLRDERHSLVVDPAPHPAPIRAHRSELDAGGDHDRRRRAVGRRRPAAPARRRSPRASRDADPTGRTAARPRRGRGPRPGRKPALPRARSYARRPEPPHR